MKVKKLSLKIQLLIVAGIMTGFVFVYMIYDLPGEYIKQGDRQYDLNEYEFAIQNYRQALKYDANDPEVYLKLGQGEAAFGNPLNAASAYTKAIELGYERIATAYIGLGWSQYSLAQYEDAARNFQRAVEVMSADSNLYTDSELAEAYSGQGWVAIVTEGCEAANQYFERGLAIASDLRTLTQGQRQCDTQTLITPQ